MENLTFHHIKHTIRAYFDVDWVRDLSNRYSATDNYFFRGKKQIIVSRSSTKARYHALVDTSFELIWLWWLLQDKGFTFSSAIPLHCDNQNVTKIAHKDVFHEHTKHIEIDCQVVRHHVLQGTAQLVPISS